MSLTVAIYGKGGIGKSTTSSNLSVSFAKKGKKVLQIGCDPKHDSTYPLVHRLIPTVIEILDKYDFHHEDIKKEDIIFNGYANVSVVETGGPSPGTGCGGYVIGETIKILENMSIFEEYDVVIFDVLGDIVCGGFSVPLQYTDKACIIATNDFDSLFATNRIISAIVEKGEDYPVDFAGIIANRCQDTAIINKFTDLARTTLIETIGDIEELRKSKIRGKTLFEFIEKNETLSHLIDPFEKITEYLLKNKEKSHLPTFFSDREMFKIFLDKNEHFS